jgi:hypothetical protein
MSLEARLQAASSDYQKLQADLSNAVEARQRLDAQLSENELVKKVRSILPSQRAGGLTHTRHWPGVLHTDAKQRRLQARWASTGQTGSGRCEEQC